MKDEEHEESEDFEDVEDEEGEEDEETPTPQASNGEVEGEVESSLEELIAKKEDRKPVEEEEEEEESILTVEREERLEPLAVKVVPPQPTEFVCKKCHLVKHRSQLKDRAKQLCRDCA
jgi:hypothetical protein